jgi:LPS export ABC transporter protein LptC
MTNGVVTFAAVYQPEARRARGDLLMKSCAAANKTLSRPGTTASLTDKICWMMSVFGISIKWLLLMALLLLGGVVVWTLVQEKRSSQHEPTAQPVASSSAEMTLAGIEFTEIEQQQKRWTLKAATARYFQNEQKTELNDVHLIFFLKSGEDVQLQSQAGVLYAGTKNIELLGGVQAVVSKVYSLTTQYAFYDHQRKTISSTTALYVQGPEILLEGQNWEYSMAEQRARIQNGVTATIRFSPRFPAKTNK